MALLQVLKVSVPATAPATGTKDYYFQGGYVYKDAAVATATGISIVTDFQHDEPLCSIEQLVLSKKIMRFVAELEATDTAGKKVKKTLLDGYDPHDVAQKLRQTWAGGLGDSSAFTHVDMRQLMGWSSARWDYGFA